MEILITSKTHKGKAACVGGMILATNRLVRLLNPGNWDQYSDTPFEVGDIWEIQFVNREDLIPPHIEDIIISSKRFVRKLGNITNHINNCGIEVFSGALTNAFDGKLKWTRNGSGYIDNPSDLPANSVCFWVADKTLKAEENHYVYSPNKKLPYVGYQNAIDEIPAGTILRLSLARWWKPEDSDIGKRCYLQLSGWYELPLIIEEEESDYLPF
jgi:hypothetical protein